MRVGRRDDMARAEGAHVQPERRRARAAVINERHGASTSAVFKVGDVKHRRLGGWISTVALVARSGSLVMVRIARDVVPTLGMHHESAGDGLIGNRVSVDRDGAVAGHRLRFERLEFVAFSFLGAVGIGLLIRWIGRRRHRPTKNHGQHRRPQSISKHESIHYWPPEFFVASTPSPCNSAANPACRRRLATSPGTSRPLVSLFGVPV